MIPALILAAGASTRMGTPKALVPDAEGRPFVLRVVETLTTARVDEILVVVGVHAEPIRAVLEAARAPVRIVTNSNAERGQLSSLQAGLTTIDRPGVTAALVTLVDVPLVLPATVEAVLAAYRRTRALVVRPARGDRHGHPVIFDRALFLELAKADPALGAKPVMSAHARDILDVPVTDEGAFQDFDTPAEYERVFGRPAD